MIFKDKMTVDVAKELYDNALQRHSVFRATSTRAHSQYYSGLTGHDKDSTFGLVYNATKELIDAQLSIDIPAPMVRPQIDSKANRARARAITAMLRSEMERLPMQTLNDIFERESHIAGASVAVVEYGLKKGSRRGEITIKHIPATDFIPQPDIYNVDDMDYYFIIEDVTKSSVVSRYGEKFRGMLEGEGVAEEGSAGKDNEDIVTLVLMFYRLNTNWAHIAWVGNTELVNLDNYFARKDNICLKCGEVMGEVCSCGSKKSELRTREGTVLKNVLQTPYHTIDNTLPVVDDDGEPVMQEVKTIDPTTGEIIQDFKLATKPRIIPYYNISCAPVCIRQNGTVAGQLFGKSDCEAIRSLQEGMNIASTKILEKMVNSGYIMTKPENMSFELTNVMGSVLSVEAPDQLAMMRTIAFEFNSQQDYNVLDKSYQYAKAVLAVTDSFQGKQDVTALSGRAKQAQIAQSAGVKRVLGSLKNHFYSKIYRAIFEAMLAFDDDERMYSDRDNPTGEGYSFKRSDFLEMDKNGNIFFEDRFIFSVDETGVNPNNRSEILQYISQDFSAGLYGDPSTTQARLNVWRERQYLDFPGSSRQVEFWEQQIEKEQNTIMLQEKAAESKMEDKFDEPKSTKGY